MLTAVARRINSQGRNLRCIAQRSSSSFLEPNPTLVGGGGRAEVAEADESGYGRDSQLRKDVRTMGSVLGQVILAHEGEDVVNKVEKLRALAKRWRQAGAGRGDESQQDEAAQAFHELTGFASSLSNSDLFWVSRSFTHFLSMANTAEGHHRGRLLKTEEPQQESDVHALYHRDDSCGGTIPSLAAQHGSDVVWDCLTTQQTELVLTAHPTEVNRRTILDKQKRIQKILKLADEYRNSKIPATPHQIAELNEGIEREIASLWQSDEVARLKPSPQVEAERGTLVVETVLWDAVPEFLRRLDATMKAHLQRGLPLDAAPIKFASWMGGDRDGNPNVTPNVTREVCLMKRFKAASLFHRELTILEGELSFTNCSDELRAAVHEDAREPYRAFLKQMNAKLEATIKWADTELQHLRTTGSTFGAAPPDAIYLSEQDLRDDLMVMHRSLCETKNEITANGHLSDILRNLAAFGLTLVPLDIRQESDRHTEALDCITRHLGEGSYAQWDEQTKLRWLQRQLASKQPLMRPGDWDNYPEIFTYTAIDTLETFRMISEQHDGSLGAYVISQATTASDVLAVLLLQLDAGVKDPLRVVPLFETLDDLNGAAATMESLFTIRTYMGSIQGKQEVMIGYSDSAKDAGRLAASWAQYETQEKLAEVAKTFGVDLTFFHGKGGTVGRGGNPATFKAILAHAPETIRGRFRVTEQGEMINQNLGDVSRANRTMDIYTAAVLSEKLTERPKPNDEWRAMMNKLSDISCEAYRRVVRKDERFVPYFRSATPEVEFADLNIGSRPSKRRASGGVESLRAIPWIFAWTQTRLNLPTWLGVGEALGEVLNSDDEDKLREMYEQWGSFRTTIDLVEMVLAKSEPAIAQNYDRLLVHDEKAKELGTEVRAIHEATEKAVLELTEHASLGEGNTVLARSLKVRNPYVDCLNVLQAETLKRIRETETDTDADEEKILRDALMTSITGIANGMGNTG